MQEAPHAQANVSMYQNAPYCVCVCVHSSRTQEVAFMHHPKSHMYVIPRELIYLEPTI